MVCAHFGNVSETIHCLTLVPYLVSETAKLYESGQRIVRSQPLAQVPVACSTVKSYGYVPFAILHVLQATGSWVRAWERGQLPDEL